MNSSEANMILLNRELVKQGCQMLTREISCAAVILGIANAIDQKPPGHPYREHFAASLTWKACHRWARTVLSPYFPGHPGHCFAAEADKAVLLSLIQSEMELWKQPVHVKEFNAMPLMTLESLAMLCRTLTLQVSAFKANRSILPTEDIWASTIASLYGAELESVSTTQSAMKSVPMEKKKKRTHTRMSSSDCSSGLIKEERDAATSAESTRISKKSRTSPTKSDCTGSITGKATSVSGNQAKPRKIRLSTKTLQSSPSELTQEAFSKPVSDLGSKSVQLLTSIESEKSEYLQNRLGPSSHGTSSPSNLTGHTSGEEGYLTPVASICGVPPALVRPNVLLRTSSEDFLSEALTNPEIFTQLDMTE